MLEIFLNKYYINQTYLQKKSVLVKLIGSNKILKRKSSFFSLFLTYTNKNTFEAESIDERIYQSQLKNKIMVLFGKKVKSIPTRMLFKYPYIRMRYYAIYFLYLFFLCFLPFFFLYKQFCIFDSIEYHRYGTATR